MIVLHYVLSCLTMVAKINAGIPNPRDKTLSIPQTTVVITASIRKLWGAGRDFRGGAVVWKPRPAPEGI